MRTTYLFILLLGYAFLGGCATNNELLPHTFILPSNTGQELLKQCSRDIPADISDFWSPSVEDVNYADRNIAGYFDTIKSKKSGETCSISLP